MLLVGGERYDLELAVGVLHEPVQQQLDATGVGRKIRR
jgi:hypothetical protein